MHRWKITIAVAGMALAGCASPSRKDGAALWPAAQDPVPAPSELLLTPSVRAAENCLLPSYRRAVGIGEGDVCTGRERPDHRPALGLALSGGGMRSGSSSIGVMQALSEMGLLDQIDIISSVSGGGYASYWYATRYFWGSKENVGTQPAVAKTLVETTSEPLRSANEIFLTYYPYCWEKDTDAKMKESGRLFLEEGKNDDCVYYRRGKWEVYANEPYRIEPTERPAISKPRRFQRHIENHGSLAIAQDTPWSRTTDLTLLGVELVTELGLWLSLYPLHALTNGLFNGQFNLNSLEWGYEMGIERTFGIYPTRWDFSERSNARPDVFPLWAENPPIAALGNEARRGRIPLVIFNATAPYGGHLKWARDHSWSTFTRDLKHVVYEFSPVAYGNEAFGYCPYETEGAPFGWACHGPSAPDLGEIVMMSGAAVDDLVIPDKPFRQMLVNAAADGLNLSLGKFIANPRASDASRFWTRLIPFPFYIFERFDENKASVYLSDGGHAENLGLYALLKRGVKNIIAVDNEHEPRTDNDDTLAIFDSLQRLRCHLYREHGLRLVAADQREETLQLAGALGAGTACQALSREDIGFDFTNDSPILLFDVCPVGNAQCPGKMRIIYVKLSVDGAKHPLLARDTRTPKHERLLKIPDTCDTPQDAYSCEVYYQRAFADAHDIDYPQDSTSDIFYSKLQYVAYRSLGHDMGRLIRSEYFLP